jgi:pyrroloquinoline quinone (PQQ) biosynthesis protein C
MFHFTKDGEYVDGVGVSNQQSMSQLFLQQLANTYEGCHTWTFAVQWHSMPAVALAYERWSPETTSTVPECVRVAEMLRGE